MDNIKELYNQRVERLENTISNGQADRVPVASLVTTWAYYYLNKKPLHSFTEPELNEQVLRALYKDFYFDCAILQRNGKSFTQRTIDLLGGGTYAYDKNGMQQTRPNSITVMEADEYPDLIKDPYAFILNKVFPRRYELMRRTDPQKYSDMVEVVTEINNMFVRFKVEDAIPVNEFGVVLSRIAALYNPVDIILDYMRDFKEIIMDIKRQPEMVRDAGLALVDFCLDLIGNAHPEKGRFLFVPMHLPQFLNRRDFEKVYWPSWKKMIEGMKNRGFKTMYYFERNYEHLYEYLQELPNGHTIGLFEGDDMRKAKKELGKNMCIAGGMPLRLLNQGTKQQCIDYAKGLIDDLAPGGGYIFTTDMIQLSESDGKAENMKAVNEFVHQYGLYK